MKIKNIIAKKGSTLMPSSSVIEGALSAIAKLMSRKAPSEAESAALSMMREAAPEQKMLQGFYRGFAGDYDAAKAAENAGMVFVTPQRAAAEYYANKRAAQMVADPHLEMVLADPFSGYIYGHAIPTGPTNRTVDFTKARQLQPEDVKDVTRLYAHGGAVRAPLNHIKECSCHG